MTNPNDKLMQIRREHDATAKRHAQREANRYTGAQAGQSYGGLFFDAAGHLIGGTAGSAIPPIYTYNAIEQLIPANTLTRIDFDQADFDDDSHITTGASWVYTADASVEGMYEVYATVNIVIDSSDPAWLVTDAAQLHLKVGSRTFAPAAISGLDISGADRSITLQITGCNDVYAGDTIYASVELIGSSNDRYTEPGSCRLHIKRYAFP